MAETFTIKENDTRPVYMAVLKDQVGTPSEAPIDLTDATSVLFLMRLVGAPEDAAPKVSGAATFVDRVNGVVSYAWQTGDTSVDGSYNCEWQITWSDGGIETVPNDTFDSIIVAEDLGP